MGVQSNIPLSQFALVRDENGEPVMQAAETTAGQNVSIDFSDGKVAATIGNKTVIQYRGGVMPIVPLGSVLGLDADPSPELLQVVVCNVRGGNVGFQVDRIRDICSVSSHERFPTGNYGIPHSVVVHDRVTALLDLEQVIEVSGVTPCNLAAIEENAAAAVEVLA